MTTHAREGAFLSEMEVSQYVYDVLGNLDKILHSNGIITNYNYDILNRLKEVIHSNDSGTPDDTADDVVVEKFEYEYHANGNKSGETATDKDGNTNTWNWDYDALGRLVRERHDNHDNDLDYDTRYVFDLVGNRLEKNTDKNGDNIIDEQILASFDENDRMLNEKTVLNGQDTSRTDYTYNGTEQTGKTVTDLLNSRVESKTQMEYNAQGRLSKITIETYVDGALSKIVTQEYEYDSSGIKVKQTESVDENADGVVDNEKITEYLNDKQNHTGYSQVLEERTSENGGAVKVTTYTIGHDVLAQYSAATGLLTLLADGHGSTRAVADKFGAILQQYNYDAYGNALGFDASEALTNLLYSGEQFNPVSGLQYLRARWYNPQSGTFNRLDPFAGDRNSPLSFHKYAYTHNNPVSGVDPRGEFLILIAALALVGPLLAQATAIGFLSTSPNFRLSLWSEESYLNQVDIQKENIYNALAKGLIDAGTGSNSLARNMANKIASAYAEELLSFRRKTLKDEYYTVYLAAGGPAPLAGRVANALSGLSRIGFFSGKYSESGCLPLAQDLTRVLGKVDPGEQFFKVTHMESVTHH